MEGYLGCLCLLIFVNSSAFYTLGAEFCGLTQIPLLGRILEVSSRKAYTFIFKPYVTFVYVPWCAGGGQRTTLQSVLSSLLYVCSRGWTQVARLVWQTPLSTKPSQWLVLRLESLLTAFQRLHQFAPHTQPSFPYRLLGMGSSVFFTVA